MAKARLPTYFMPPAPVGGSWDETSALRVSSTVPVDDDQRLDWTLALAGGEGVRLQDYIERKCGRRIPKQYCQLLGSRSMLEHTLARLNQLTPASRTLTVIGTDHKAYAMPQLSGSSDHVFCQPSSRDTGVALYVALAMIRRWTPNATVTITPTDHYVEPNERYLQHLRVGRHIATRVRDLVVLLGVKPSEPDPDFGYIMTGGHLTDVPQARTVVGFVEKPTVARAEQLIGAGALWNTMVACGTVDALWSLGRSAVPKLIAVLDFLVPLIGTSDESDAIDYIYRAYRPVSFSTDVLQHRADRLAVIELNGVEWSDWGRPERVETTLALRRNRASTRGAASASTWIASGQARRTPWCMPAAREATVCSSQTWSELVTDSPISSHHHLGDDSKPKRQQEHKEHVMTATQWDFDKVHSSINFSVRHLMVSKVRGQFHDWSGTLLLDHDDITQSRVEVVIQAASIDTKEESRDAHLRNLDFFDVAKFPTLGFKSTSIDRVSNEEIKIHGDLTMHGVTKPVTLVTEVNGIQKDPWGGTRTGFSASVTIQREDYGLHYNAALEAGGVVVGKKVEITLEIEAVKKAEEKAT